MVQLILFANIDNFTQKSQQISNLFDSIQQLSDTTITSVDEGYQDLGTYIQEKNISNQTIQLVEAKYEQMSSSFDELKSTLNKVENEANTLFRLLRKRARESTDTNLREKMIFGISDKEAIIQEKISIVKQVLSEISLSIQNYDNILGYIQVTTITEQTGNQILGDINLILEKSQLLRANIRQSMEDAKQIIQVWINYNNY